MEIVGLLAPVAFVFALAALAQVEQMKREMRTLKESVVLVEEDGDRPVN